MDRYRNNYNNSFEDEHSGGTWVYMNGELYHAGIKGMHWYQHLPGTDWWKLAKRTYSNYMNKNTTTERRPGYQYVDGKMVPYEPQTKRPSKLKALYETGKNVGRAALASTKSYLKGEASYYSNKLKNSKAGQAVSKGWQSVSGELSKFAQNAWGEIRGKTQAVFKSYKSQEKIDRNTNVNATFLDAFQSSQYGDALKNYTDGKSNGSVGNTINQFIQNAQYGIVKGVNTYLKKMGWDDEVDSFFNKITGGKSRTYANRYVKDNRITKPSTPYNGNEQRNEQRYEQSYETPEERKRRLQQERNR